MTHRQALSADRNIYGPVHDTRNSGSAASQLKAVEISQVSCPVTKAISKPLELIPPDLPDPELCANRPLEGNNIPCQDFIKCQEQFCL